MTIRSVFINHRQYLTQPIPWDLTLRSFRNPKTTLCLKITWHLWPEFNSKKLFKSLVRIFSDIFSMILSFSEILMEFNNQVIFRKNKLTKISRIKEAEESFQCICWKLFMKCLFNTTLIEFLMLERHISEPKIQQFPWKYVKKSTLLPLVCSALTSPRYL